MNKYILSLVWIGSLALSHAGTDSKDMKELTPVVAQTPKDAFAVFTGFGGRNSSWYSYAGAIYALNGDINSSGLFLRSQIGGGQYAYSTPLIQGRVRGTIFDADLSFGYKNYFDKDWSASIFVGPHYRSRDLNVVDPGSDITSSDKVGARTGLEITGTPGCIYLNGQAQFSTVDMAVWSRARVGYNFTSDGIIVGPEGLYFRDKDFDEYRGGAFTTFQIDECVALTVSGGYAHFTSPNGVGSSNSSPYGDVGLSFGF